MAEISTSGGSVYGQPIGANYTTNQYLQSIYYSSFTNSKKALANNSFDLNNPFMLTFFNVHMGKFKVKNSKILKKIWSSILYIAFFNGAVAVADFTGDWMPYWASVSSNNGFLPLTADITLTNETDKNTYTYSVDLQKEDDHVFIIRSNLFMLPEFFSVAPLINVMPTFLERINSIAAANVKRYIASVPQGTSRIISRNLSKVLNDIEGTSYSVVYDDEEESKDKNKFSIGNIRLTKLESPNDARAMIDVADWFWSEALYLNGIPTNPQSTTSKKDHAIEAEFANTDVFNMALNCGKLYGYLQDFIEQWNEKTGENAELISNFEQQYQNDKPEQKLEGDADESNNN